MSSDESRPEQPAPSSRRAERVEAVRRAVDQAVGATADGTRARAQDLVDELGQVAARVRGALEDLGSAGTAQAGAVADELQQVAGRLGRALDVRPASADELRELQQRIDRWERDVDRRLARIEARLGIDPVGSDADRDDAPPDGP